MAEDHPQDTTPQVQPVSNLTVIGRNTAISLSALALVLAPWFYTQRQVSQLNSRLVTAEQQVKAHVENPNYHQGLRREIDQHYVRKDQLEHLTKTLEELKAEVRSLRDELRRNP